MKITLSVDNANAVVMIVIIMDDNGNIMIYVQQCSSSNMNTHKYKKYK